MQFALGFVSMIHQQRPETSSILDVSRSSQKKGVMCTSTLNLSVVKRYYHSTRCECSRNAGPAKHLVNRSAIFVAVSSFATLIVPAAIASRAR